MSARTSGITLFRIVHLASSWTVMYQIWVNSPQTYYRTNASFCNLSTRKFSLYAKGWFCWTQQTLCLDSLYFLPGLFLHIHTHIFLSAFQSKRLPLVVAWACVVEAVVECQSQVPKGYRECRQLENSLREWMKGEKSWIIARATLLTGVHLRAKLVFSQTSDLHRNVVIIYYYN